MLASLVPFVERRCVFYNWGPTRSLPRSRAADYEEVWLTTSDGVRLHANFFACPDTIPNPFPGPRLSVLFLRGTGGTIRRWRVMGGRWHDALGANVLLFDYRGFGRSGGVASEEGLYRDGDAAYEWLVQTRGVAPSRIVIVGQSLGGGVATHLAVTVPHAALVLESTFTTIPDVAAGLPLIRRLKRHMRLQFPNELRLAGYSRPLFVSHGQRDRLVPPSHAERLIDVARGPKELLVIPRMAHLDARDADYSRRVRLFLADIAALNR
jgi:fermentation-respiration switch protein FrsA (DUF1100 family)